MRKIPLIGFAVMGGIFSEGIDLKGERLSSVVVIGVGLPHFSRMISSRIILIVPASGDTITPVYPGMNKVAQAGGRLIPIGAGQRDADAR